MFVSGADDVVYAGDMWYLLRILLILLCTQGFGQRNTENVGKLLLLFFNFYSTFDFKRLVVCVRKGKPLTKKDKVRRCPGFMQISMFLFFACGMSASCIEGQGKALSTKIGVLSVAYKQSSFKGPAEMLVPWGLCLFVSPTVLCSDLI